MSLDDKWVRPNAEGGRCHPDKFGRCFMCGTVYLKALPGQERFHNPDAAAMAAYHPLPRNLSMTVLTSRLHAVVEGFETSTEALRRLVTELDGYLAGPKKEHN